MCLLVYFSGCISICGYAILRRFYARLHVFYDPIVAAFPFSTEFLTRTHFHAAHKRFTLPPVECRYYNRCAMFFFIQQLRARRGPTTIYIFFEMNFLRIGMKRMHICSCKYCAYDLTIVVILVLSSYENGFEVNKKWHFSLHCFSVTGLHRAGSDLDVCAKMGQ